MGLSRFDLSRLLRVMLRDLRWSFNGRGSVSAEEGISKLW